MDDPKKTKWDLFIILLALYNAYSIPFEIAFAPESLESVGVTLLNAFVDLCFLMDLIFSFRTTYIDTLTGDEVKNLK